MQTPPRSQPPSTPAPDLRRRQRAAARRARQRVLRRRRVLALALVVASIGSLVAALSGGGSTSAPAPRHRLTGGSGDGGPARSRASTGAVPRRPRPSAPFAVGLTTMRLVDGTRSIRLPDGATVPRTLETYVRYPAYGPATRTDLNDATPARAAGPFPLIVFGHGFDVTPALYASLLEDWARAGYVVAAPVFPLSNPAAPGGPTEADLPNQPPDMRFVISRMLSASGAPSGLISGLIAEREIAVAGQSDGGDTALAVADDPRFRDSRVRAAVILSGAEIPGIGAFTIQPGGPPLLATQGTADPINPPSATSAFYDRAPAPKYLLQLLGATHLSPYSSQAPQLGIVARVTTVFLDHYLKHTPPSLGRLLEDGNVPGIATLSAGR